MVQIYITYVNIYYIVDLKKEKIIHHINIKLMFQHWNFNDHEPFINIV